jgi:sulfur carrier protein
MDIHINQQPYRLAEEATVADALAAFGAQPPFAVALNGEFVARARHAAQPLRPGDRIDVVRPVAGG